MLFMFVYGISMDFDSFGVVFSNLGVPRVLGVVSQLGAETSERPGAAHSLLFSVADKLL